MSFYLATPPSLHVHFYPGVPTQVHIKGRKFTQDTGSNKILSLPKPGNVVFKSIMKNDSPNHSSKIGVLGIL
jgi:hypothetical protein